MRDADQEVTTMTLEALRTYMYHFYPERQTREPSPLDFWTFDDGLFYDFMNYLPAVFAVQFRGLSEHALRQLPEALQIFGPIFSLEDGYDCDGWTALNNAGEHELPLVIVAYQRIGMSGEAAALTAVLRACRNGVEEDDSDI